MKSCACRLLSILLLGFCPAASLLAAPANDSFSTPNFVTGMPVTTTGSNVGATLQVGEMLPDATGFDGNSYCNASVWFQWTSPVTGAVQIDTFGSGFDTILAVWTGSDVTSISEVSSCDEFDGSQSAVFIDVVIGTTYRIAVYGYQADAGKIVLNISNDTTSRIAGTVTGPDGTTPLVDIAVMAYRLHSTYPYWRLVNSAKTQADGSY